MVTAYVHARVVHCDVHISSTCTVHNMDYCIKGINRVRRASVADNHRYHFLDQSLLPPQSVSFTVIHNKVQLIDATCHHTFWSISATINVSSVVLNRFQMILPWE